MGLISDYLEELRDNILMSGGLDPCMIIRNKSTWKINPLYSREHIELPLVIHNSREKNATQKTLQHQVDALIRSRLQCQLAEKYLLEIINTHKCSSFIIDDLEELQRQFYCAFISINDTINEICKNNPSILQNNTFNINHSLLRQHLLELLMNSIENFMIYGSPVDSPVFRHIISDCALMIRLLGQDASNTSNKALVWKYFHDDLHHMECKHTCINCKKPLLTEIPYCFGCYERNDYYDS